MEKIWIQARNWVENYYEEYRRAKSQGKSQIAHLEQKINNYENLYTDLVSQSRKETIDVAHTRVTEDLREQIAEIHRKMENCDQVLAGNTPDEARFIRALLDGDKKSVEQIATNTTCTAAQFVYACSVIETDEDTAREYLKGCFANAEYEKRARMVEAFVAYYDREKQREQDFNRLKNVKNGVDQTISQREMDAIVSRVLKAYNKEEADLDALSEFVSMQYEREAIQRQKQEIERKCNEWKSISGAATKIIEQENAKKKERMDRKKGNYMTNLICVACLIPLLLIGPLITQMVPWIDWIPKGVFSYLPIPYFTTDVRITEEYDAPYIFALGHIHYMRIDGAVQPKKWLTKFAEFDDISFCTEAEEISIPEHAKNVSFYDCGQITSLSIPGGIREVGIEGCNLLEEVNLQPGLESFRMSACKQVTSLTIPEDTKVVSISDCSRLRELILPEGVERVEINNCKKLTSLTIPGETAEISVYDCPGLKKLVLTQSDKVEETDGTDEADTSERTVSVRNCKKLTSVKLAPNTYEIQLESCNRLKKLVIPTAVKNCYIYDCKKLETVKLSKKVENLSLDDCNSLQNLSLAKNMESLKVYDCSQLKTIKIPKNVKDVYVTRCESLSDFSLDGGTDNLEISECGSLWKVTTATEIPSVNIPENVSLKVTGGDK